MFGFFGGAVARCAHLAEPLGSRLADGRAQVPIAIICVLMCSMFGQLLGGLGRRASAQPVSWQVAAHAFDAGRRRRAGRRLGAARGVDGRRAAGVLAVPVAGCGGQPLVDRARGQRRHAGQGAHPLQQPAVLPEPERVPPGVRRPAEHAHLRRRRARSASACRRRGTSREGAPLDREGLRRGRPVRARDRGIGLRLRAALRVDQRPRRRRHEPGQHRGRRRPVGGDGRPVRPRARHRRTARPQPPRSGAGVRRQRRQATATLLWCWATPRTARSPSAPPASAPS